MNRSTRLLETSVEMRRAAMDLLARREHSRRELLRKLSARVSDDVLLQEVLLQLEDEGLISDQRFAETYIRYRSSKGFGPVRIAAELRDKGIDENLLQEHIQSSDSRWYDLAYKVKVRKFGEDVEEEPKVKAKQMRFLLNRGFVRDQVSNAVENLFDN